jgi:hypothetical protein
MRIVHQGRGGYIELDGCRYAIEHIQAGHFCIHFHNSLFQKRHEHLAQLTEFAQAQEPKWYVEVP